MTVLEEQPRAGTKPGAGAGFLPEGAKPPSGGRFRHRFTTYFTRVGWAHVLLLLAAWMFLFPFVWMLATSVKTDEELMEPGVLPGPKALRLVEALYDSIRQ